MKISPVKSVLSPSATKSDSLRGFLYATLFYNRHVKRLGIRLLNARWFVNNPVYQKLQSRQINTIIQAYRRAPNIVVIENTNRCNYRCRLCPHQTMGRDQGVMDESLFRKIIDDCAILGIQKVGLHGFGEPLLDRAFAARIKYAKERRIAHIGTSSNASLLNPKLAQDLITAGLDEVNFSLDAADKTSYEIARPGSNYDRIATNIRNFIALRNRLGRARPQVVVDMIETKENQKDTRKFIAQWVKIVDRVNITTPHSWGGVYREGKQKRDFHSSRTDLRREPCRFLWTDMVITWNGQVAACCQDYESKMIVGNTNRQSLGEIWTGPALEALRHSHLTRKMNLGLCRHCDYRSVWWLFK